MFVYYSYSVLKHKMVNITKEMYEKFQLQEKLLEEKEEKIQQLTQELNSVKKNKQKDKVVKEDKPKRKPNGYNLFVADNNIRNNAKELILQELDNPEDFSTKLIMKKISDMWKELTDEKKQEWKNKAKDTES